jgi:hypothetical protein
MPIRMHRYLLRRSCEPTRSSTTSTQGSRRQRQIPQRFAEGHRDRR